MRAIAYKEMLHTNPGRSRPPFKYKIPPIKNNLGDAQLFEKKAVADTSINTWSAETANISRSYVPSSGETHKANTIMHKNFQTLPNPIKVNRASKKVMHVFKKLNDKSIK